MNPWVSDHRANHKTLMMVHHNRKGGGDYGEGIAGGHALLGIFDIAIEVLHDVNQGRNRRLLRTYARLIESREALYEMVEPPPPPLIPFVGGSGSSRFRLLGDPKAVRRDDVAQRLLLILTTELQTTRELHDGLSDPKPSDEQVRQALTMLARGGQIERDPSITEGKVAGRTVRWRSMASNLHLQRSSYKGGGEVSELPTEPCPTCGGRRFLINGEWLCAQCLLAEEPA